MMAAAIGMIIVALALMIFCVAVMWKERWICLWADFLKYCLSSNPCVWKGRIYRSGSGEKYRSDHSQCDHWRNRYHSIGT